MPFEDLPDDDPGGEALDELAGTLSEESESEDHDDSGADEPAYDPEVEPAFPTAKSRTQHSVYCRPETWNALDGASGLLFEAEISLRRDGYESVQKRELHDAVLRAATEELDAERIAEAFVATREDRVDGPLLEEDS